MTDLPAFLPTALYLLFAVLQVIISRRAARRAGAEGVSPMVIGSGLQVLVLLAQGVAQYMFISDRESVVSVATVYGIIAPFGLLAHGLFLYGFSRFVERPGSTRTEGRLLDRY